MNKNSKSSHFTDLIFVVIWDVLLWHISCSNQCSDYHLFHHQRNNVTYSLKQNLCLLEKKKTKPTHKPTNKMKGVECISYLFPLRCSFLPVLACHFHLWRFLKNNNDYHLFRASCGIVFLPGAPYTLFLILIKIKQDGHY